MTNPNDPAFPEDRESHLPDGGCGLSKREYFAAMAMQARVIWDAEPRNARKLESIAVDSVKLAETLIAELNKELSK